jgi:hypothetical protein
MSNSLWKKQGLVFSPPNFFSSPTSNSFAIAPTPIVFKNSQSVRVFYTTLSSSNEGFVYWVDFDINNPGVVVNYSTQPVLNPGFSGFFDGNGVMATSVIETKLNQLYMYYVGFELLRNIPYRLLVGLAFSLDGGNSFEKYSTQPILERTISEPFFRGSPLVRHHNGKYQMWYVGGGSWLYDSQRLSPQYSLKYMESQDGISWPNDSTLILNPSEDGYAIGRPWIDFQIHPPLLYYSERKLNILKYRIQNRILVNKNEIGNQISEYSLQAGPEKYDEDEICYAAVVDLPKYKALYYNGNNKGEFGIALATIKK